VIIFNMAEFPTRRLPFTPRYDEIQSIYERQIAHIQKYSQ